MSSNKSRDGAFENKKKYRMDVVDIQQLTAIWKSTVLNIKNKRNSV